MEYVTLGVGSLLLVSAIILGLLRSGLTHPLAQHWVDSSRPLFLAFLHSGVGHLLVQQERLRFVFTFLELTQCLPWVRGGFFLDVLVDAGQDVSPTPTRGLLPLAVAWPSCFGPDPISSINSLPFRLF